MQKSPIVTSIPECADEPIRVPGSIQPHGWLVAFDIASSQVVAYSENCAELMGLASGPGLTAALQLVVGNLLPGITLSGPETSPVSAGTIVLDGRTCDVSTHRAGSLQLLEFEAASPPLGHQAPIYSVSHRFVPLIQKASDLAELLSVAASEIKWLTGFGRCIVYSFDAEGHCNVLAEQADPGYASYLGHRFPASDIPAQARQLYLLNRIRLIADGAYRPVALHFVDDAWNRSNFDLSFAHLRSVSPVHLEYMRNMGTLASMSVSIVVHGRLWGLISCHDHHPLWLDLQTRMACEHLGSLLSLQIEAKLNNIEIEMRHNLRKLSVQIVSALGSSEATLQALVDQEIPLLQLARAGGAAVVFDDQCWTTGQVPSVDHLLSLATWIAERGADVFESDNLGAAGAPCAASLAHAAGLLAISLSQVHRHLVIWFRPEIVQSICWAGEGVKHTDAQGRLHPRLSFESWVETVRGRCIAWEAFELAGVLELRQSLLGIVLERAQERAMAADKLRRATVARNFAEQADSAKTHFLAVLSHELRAPLASIANAVQLIGHESATPEKATKLLPMMKRNVALATRLVDDLHDVSAISAGKLTLVPEVIDMHSLVRQVGEMLGQGFAAKELVLSMQLNAANPLVMADPVRMQQVLWNIWRNAIKFTPRGGQIRIASEMRDGDFVLMCTDSGIGLDTDSLRRIFNAFEQVQSDESPSFGGLGLGLAIAMGIVEGHGGRLAATSKGLNHGSTFTLCLAVEPGDRTQADKSMDPCPA